ncbi:MAG TPA: YtxH domain-containing protein [Terriglobales bacterium]|nr:YtxH domain-containing protein [Terriglobales bacterium]
MRSRRDKILFNVLLGTGLSLLDTLRERVAESASSFSERAGETAQDLYETASGRARRAAAAIRGEDQRGMHTGLAILLGIGIGVGVGLLLAPTTGEETRNNIAKKVRDRFSEKEATGTYGA